MFTLEHWDTPRKSIATVFENNDYGYVFHGASIFIEILKHTYFTVPYIGKLKVLDYGCGTGRITRLFALTGAYVEGYDPSAPCIAEAIKEGEKLVRNYNPPALLTSDITKVGTGFNLIFCVNVLEHLNKTDFDMAIRTMESKLVDGGTMLIWLHYANNLDFCNYHGLLKHPGNGSIFVSIGSKSRGIVTYRCG